MQFLKKIFFLFLLLNLGCQTSRLKEFDDLFLGQEKCDVLDIVGTPTWSERIQGQDRWTYIIYEDRLRQEKVLYFLDGFVTYKGSPIPPLISAEEQDDINRMKNIQMQQLERTQYGTYSTSQQNRSAPSQYK